MIHLIHPATARFNKKNVNTGKKASLVEQESMGGPTAPSLDTGVGPWL